MTITINLYDTIVLTKSDVTYYLVPISEVRCIVAKRGETICSVEFCACNVKNYINQIHPADTIDIPLDSLRENLIRVLNTSFPSAQLRFTYPVPTGCVIKDRVPGIYYLDPRDPDNGKSAI